MRMVFVTGSISRAAGGLFDGVRRLAQSVFEQGEEVRAFGLQDKWSAADAPLWKPVEAQAFRVVGHRGFSLAPSLGRELLDVEGDLVCSHGLWRYTSVAVHAWHLRRGLPYVVHPHGMLDGWAVRNSRWKKRVASICYEAAHLRDAACICALCEAEADAIRRYGLRNPIAIIPNGVDVEDAGAWERESARAWSEKGIGDGRSGTARTPSLPGARAASLSERRTLLFLGRIHPKKGLVNLLKAWKEVRARGWMLAIAGWDDGGHEAELRQLCARTERKEGREERVVFLGPQFGEAKAECYRRCDAFILPSLSEGLPMAVLEAWSYAKPVLMTPECHLPEGFRAGAALEIGAAEPGIERGLRELMAMTDSELAQMGQRGRELVRARFNWKSIGAQMQAVCAWVTGNGPRPDCVEALSNAA